MIKLNLTNDIFITDTESPVIFNDIEKNTETNITYDILTGKVIVDGNFIYRASLGDYYDDVMTPLLLEVETIPLEVETIPAEEMTGEIKIETEPETEPEIIPTRKLPIFSIKFNLYDGEKDTFIKTLKQFPSEIDILPEIIDQEFVDLDCTFTYIRKNTDVSKYILKVINEGEGNVKIKTGNILTLETF
jgi:hypothetical protein